MSFAFFSREECLYSQAIFKFIRHIKRRSEAGHRIVTGPMVSGSCPFMRSPSAVANCKCSPLLRRRWHLEDGRCMTGRFTHRPKSVLGDRLRADCHGRLLGVVCVHSKRKKGQQTSQSAGLYLFKGNSFSPRILQPHRQVKHRLLRPVVNTVRHKVPMPLKLKLVVRLGVGQ